MDPADPFYAQLPQGCGVPVAKNGARAATQHGTEPAPLARHFRPAGGVNATPQRMEPAGLDPVLDRRRRVAELDQLRPSDDPVLATHQPPRRLLSSSGG